MLTHQKADHALPELTFYADRCKTLSQRLMHTKIHRLMNYLTQIYSWEERQQKLETNQKMILYICDI